MENTNTEQPGIDLDRDTVMRLMLENDMLSQSGYRTLINGDCASFNLDFLTKLANTARRLHSGGQADERAARAVDALDGMGFTYDEEIGWHVCRPTAPLNTEGKSDGEIYAEVSRRATLAPVAAQQAAAEQNDAKLQAAIQWLNTVQHGDNCFVSDHYPGDPGNRCNCGKDSLLQYIESDEAKQ